MPLETTLAHAPLIAILRGLRPENAIDVAAVLYDEGFRLIEVPLNSPDPFTSLARLVHRFGDDAVIGAGTVTDSGDLARLHDIGIRLVIAPNCNVQLITEAKSRGMSVFPGVATPTEAFAALQAGADGLKLFPAEIIGTSGLRAWKAVLPAAVPLVAVGGVTIGTIEEWAEAGADGFGIGSALFTPEVTLSELKNRARSLRMLVTDWTINGKS